MKPKAHYLAAFGPFESEMCVEYCIRGHGGRAVFLDFEIERSSKGAEEIIAVTR